MNTFYERWKDKGDEKSDTQTFWFELIQDVLHINNPGKYIEFEKRVELSHVSFIDAYIPSTGIIIEQKSVDVNLDAKAKQSDGTLATPFEQAKRYYDWLPKSQKGRYIITCNFKELRIHDMEAPKAEPRIIMLDEFEHRSLDFLIKPERELTREEIISLEAGRLAGRLYNSVKPRYKEENEKNLQNLNIFCVRIVFILYAEDSGILDKSQFHDFIASHVNTARTSLLDLFRTLKTKLHERDPYIDDDLNKFPYINGGLFDEEIDIPKIDGEPLEIIIHEMSEGFDWSEINPTIFGAIFESTLNPDTRTEGGMRYTTIRNIHRVIDALFLDKLTKKLDDIMNMKDTKGRTEKLMNFQNELASLTFLDPACGSGNFLTETYLSLRRLENRIIEELSHGQIHFAEGSFSPIKVSIAQFYGIEVNDFAVAVARTALWIAEHQMMRETKKSVKIHDDFLPLKTYEHIIEKNAIQFDWHELIHPDELTYIMGNPPFRGARIIQAGHDQKKDIRKVFEGWDNPGNFDYVCCWYKKAHDFMKGTDIKAAFVSTNSINQGELVSIFWKPLLDDGMHIDFAYRTFIWNSESEDKVHVHCVIVGFSFCGEESTKRIYDTVNDDVIVSHVSHINAYLIDAPDWYISRRETPITDGIPAMRIGNKPIDRGHYLFTMKQYEEFIRKEPASKKYFHLWYGGQEFLYSAPRMCLYLGNCTPHEISMIPKCKEIVESVRAYRVLSPSVPTQKLADIPTRFHVETFPKGNYIVVPKTSSGNRTYIPIGFFDDSVMCADSLRIIPNATLYHFGVLESIIHMAWMRVVTGRLKSDYSYSNGLVYNCFVWPSVNEKQRLRIEKTAQGILDAREKYPDSNLAELYDESIMPKELRKAHRANDEAVRSAYGFRKGMSELEVVGELMKMYERLIESKER